MTKNRLATAFTAVSLVAIVTACAGPGNAPRSASIFGGKVDTANIGLATKAQMALATNDVATAIPLAERAVEKSPRDAGFRALLGNCYLAAGRFASAEAAFKDSLSLIAEQPQVILKLALVEIAQGKNDEAKYLLAQGQGILDPADVGLALALAGDPRTAVTVLEPAARATGADSRTRQNLALAYALAGDLPRARRLLAAYESDVPEGIRRGRWEWYEARGWLALSQARHRDAIAAFVQGRRSSNCVECGAGEEGLAYDRAGMADSALAAYERAVISRSAWKPLGDRWNLAPSLKRLGELYEARGDRVRALENYGRFVELWKNADPELQPAVREVRERMATLAGERK